MSNPLQFLPALALYLLIALPGFPAISGEATEKSFDKQRLERLDNYLARLVDAKQISGMHGLILHKGAIVHKVSAGWRSRENKTPVGQNSLFRIYSMTKPVTAVAALILYEHGYFELNQPISDFVPEFGQLQVYVSGEGADMVTEPLESQITFRHLLTHTSGFTYHFMGDSPVQHLYRQKGILPGAADIATRPDDAAPLQNLEAMTQALFTTPLLHQPGERYSYSISMDVLGYMIERISGKSLDAFMRENIFDPLEMSDTTFHVSDEKLARLTTSYAHKAGSLVPIDTPKGSDYRNPDRIKAGGAGLVSTTSDYMKFTQMLLNGGHLNGVHILSPRTVGLMFSNHMSDQTPFPPDGRPGFGQGLGFGLIIEPGLAGTMSSAGEVFGAGAATTFFWIDRQENIAAVFMTQLLPNTQPHLMSALRTLTYQALGDE